MTTNSIYGFQRSESEVIYLLLQIGFTTSDRPIVENENILKAADFLGIVIRETRFSTYSLANRMVFYFPNYVRNDSLATRIAESIFYATCLIHGPLGEDGEAEVVFPMPRNVIKDIQKIELETLISVEEESPHHLRKLLYPATSLSSVSYVNDHHLDQIFTIVPVLYEEKNYLNAVRFFIESQKNFYVWTGQVDDVIKDSISTFESGWELTRMESALINIFKTIEALIGDPSSDDKKLIRKLSEIGFDPFLEFGIDPRVPLFEYIRVINRARDKASAHGRTPRSKVLVRDMFLYQDCARYLLINFLNRRSLY